MSRDYRLIKNGKFTGESFNVNAAGSIYLGLIMKGLGLPVSGSSEFLHAPHEITGDTAKAVRSSLNDPGFGARLRSVIAGIPDRQQFSGGTLEEDAQWATEFFRMALNEEGFASDYCEEYQ